MTILKAPTPRQFLILVMGLMVLLAACSNGNDAQQREESGEVSFRDVAAINQENNDTNNNDPVNTSSGDEPFAGIAIPELPFPDNPDPNECGIPQPYGPNNNMAYLNGFYQGELVQPTVYLYDSHGRNTITAAGEHGTEVEVVLFQANPVLNYYFVKIPSAPQEQREGWVPEPFLSFQPVSSLETVTSQN